MSDWTFVEWASVAAVVSAFAMVVAAIAATSAACQASKSIQLSKKQSEDDFRWRKIDRTYAHSPYRNDKFLEAINTLTSEYSHMKITQNEFWKALDDSSENKQVEKILKKPKVDSVVLVANFWGQMASEYNSELLDKKIAKNILRYNFMKFCFVFENWLRSEDRRGIYSNTLKLYDEWKKDCHKPKS